MANLLVGIIFGALVFGIVGAGLIVLNYLLAKKKQEEVFKGVKEAVIPEFESMTKRMLADSMDLVMEKSIAMTKKMMNGSLEDDD